MDPQNRRLMLRRTGGRWRAFGRWTAGLTLVLAAAGALPATAETPAPARQQALIHLVRQDCGSCHGLTLQGGLGPALTAPALRHFTVDLLAATILHGRPGTPMPPFAGIVGPAEAEWIARRLIAGFPEDR